MLYLYCTYMSSSWLTYSILLSQCLSHSRLTINVYYRSEEWQITSEVEIKVNDIPTVSSWKVKHKAEKNWGFIWINLNCWGKTRDTIFLIYVENKWFLNMELFCILVRDSWQKNYKSMVWAYSLAGKRQPLKKFWNNSSLVRRSYHSADVKLVPNLLRAGQLGKLYCSFNMADNGFY